MKRRSTPRASETTNLVPVQLDGDRSISLDVTTDAKVGEFLSRLLPAAAKAKTNPTAALLPWVCDRLLSKHSREAYARDLSAFVRHMRQQGIDPLAMTADHIKVYKAALIQTGRSATSIARAMSVIRGTYQQFGRHGLVEWERVRDIQGVASPRVEKNLTPALSEAEAKALLHAPDQSTLVGLRDHAMLFVFFKTACRCSAIASAKVGYLERTDTDWHLVVFEKGNKRQRKALLEAAAPLLAYVTAAGIGGDLDGPLFRPVAKDRQTLYRKPLDRRTIWKTVKKYAREVGIDVDRLGGRGIGVHSLRKTAITNALEHGARMEQVQQLAGHAQITTTQMYFAPQGSRRRGCCPAYSDSVSSVCRRLAGVRRYRQTGYRIPAQKSAIICPECRYPSWSPLESASRNRMETSLCRPRQQFTEQAEDMKRQVAGLEADERSYVYSLIGVASAVLGYAMYRIGDVTMLVKDSLFFLAVASAALSLLAGYLALKNRLVIAESMVWSRAIKFAMEAEEILNPTNPHLERAKAMTEDFVREYIDKDRRRALKSARFCLTSQPALLLLGSAAIFLWCIAIRAAA